MTSLFLILFAGAVAASPRLQASENVAVVVNGKPLKAAALIRDNRVQVPLRAIAESLGGTAQWYAATRTAVVQGNGKSVTLVLNQSFGYGSERAQYLDFPPRVVRGRIMVPLRFVSERLGANVRWDRTARTAYIDTGEAQ